MAVGVYVQGFILCNGFTPALLATTSPDGLRGRRSGSLWDGDWWWTICQYGPRGQAYWSGTKPYDAGEGGLVEPPASVFDDHPGLCGP